MYVCKFAPRNWFILANNLPPRLRWDLSPWNYLFPAWGGISCRRRREKYANERSGRLLLPPLCGCYRAPRLHTWRHHLKCKEFFRGDLSFPDFKFPPFDATVKRQKTPFSHIHIWKCAGGGGGGEVILAPLKNLNCRTEVGSGFSLG